MSRKPSSRGRVLFPGTAALLLSAPLLAQDAPLNSSLVGTFNQQTSSYGDIWADGNYAILARFGQNQIDVVDISNPSNPTIADVYTVPSPDTSASAQDVKSGDGLLFVGLESSSSNGVQILDFRNPNNLQFLTNVDPEPGNFEPIHNVFYDNGWLYMCNSSDNTIAIVDLRTYDPDSPPPSINNWTYQLTNVGNVFVHDITVQNGRLYASAWDSLVIYDVSNLGVQAPQFLGSVRGVSSHAVWPSPDDQFVVTTEEREGGAVRLYEIDDSSGFEIIGRDSFVLSINSAYSAHNPVWDGDRVYISYYQGGGTVLELDRTTKTLELVARYDTSTSTPFGFSGNWGVYPLAGADTVLLSDIENGMYVVDQSAVQISFVNVRPLTVAPLTDKSITIELTNLGNSVLDPLGINLNYQIDGGATQSVLMSNIGGNQYEADLPGIACGSEIDYWVSVDDLGGNTFTDPADAPSSTHTVYSATGLTSVFFDDFETNQGWTTSGNAGAGNWTRANPVEAGGQPEDDDPNGTGTQCWITGNGSQGGSDGAADVDGTTTLTSPTLDFSAGDGLIRYSEWFFNNDADVDSFLVEISNGGNFVTVENVQNRAGGWRDRAFRVSDHVTPTANVQVRFTVSDNPNDSVTEGGLDTFRAEILDCNQAAFTVSRNGTGVNPVGYVSLNNPVLGTTWNATVDIVTPGATISAVGVVDSGPFGAVLGFGEVLIDVGSPFIGGLNIAAGAHSFPIPNDPLLIGVTFYTQAGTFSTGNVQLNNAIDITCGF